MVTIPAADDTLKLVFKEHNKKSIHNFGNIVSFSDKVEISI